MVERAVPPGPEPPTPQPTHSMFKATYCCLSTNLVITEMLKIETGANLAERAYNLAYKRCAEINRFLGFNQNKLIVTRIEC